MMSRNVTFMSCLLTAAMWLGGSVSFAAPVEVKVELPNIRTIQPNAGKDKIDDIYLLVTGVAQAQAVARQVPEGKPWKSSPKAPAVTEKAPVVLWEGKLDEGQFVALTVAAFAGDKIDDAKRKAYFEKKAGSDKKVTGLTGKIDAKPALDELRVALNKENVAFYKAIGELFPKRKGDNYVGAFDVIVVNVGGKILKRVMPTGLLAGEHYGIKVKQYSKLKHTLSNVLIKEPDGQTYTTTLPPWGDDQELVRVKMTEVELVGDVNTVTDYLTDVKISAAGKPLTIELAGEHAHTSSKHVYWDWSE
jgi:hypothetical protein